MILRPFRSWPRILAFGGVLLIPPGPLYFPITDGTYGFFLAISPGNAALALVMLSTLAVLAFRLVAVRDLAAPRPLRHALGYIQINLHVMADCFAIDA